MVERLQILLWDDSGDIGGGGSADVFADFGIFLLIKIKMLSPNQEFARPRTEDPVFFLLGIIYHIQLKISQVLPTDLLVDAQQQVGRGTWLLHLKVDKLKIVQTSAKKVLFMEFS